MSDQCVPSPGGEPEDPMALRGFISISVGNMRLEFGVNGTTREQAIESLTSVANKALSIVDHLYDATPEE